MTEQAMRKPHIKKLKGSRWWVCGYKGGRWRPGATPLEAFDALDIEIKFRQRRELAELGSPISVYADACGEAAAWFPTMIKVFGAVVAIFVIAIWWLVG